MTTRHLKIFLNVYRENSITAAAKKMHISQPAVSLAVKELEGYYGVRLFERYARRLAVTPAGENLYHYANHIIASLDEVETALRGWDETGLLRLGSSITMGAQLMPRLVKEYQRLYPNVKMHLLTSGADQIEQGILNNEIDMAILEGSVRSEMICSESFMEDELGVFCGLSHPLGQKGSVTLQELGQQNLLLRDATCGTREYIESIFDVNGIRITPMWESMGSQTLVNAAVLGLGITILPISLVDEFKNRSRLKRLTVQGVELKRELNIIYHKQKALSLALQRFVQLCRNEKASA